MNRERHEQRLLLKERSAPCQHSKERCKTDEDETVRFRPERKRTPATVTTSIRATRLPMSTMEGT